MNDGSQAVGKPPRRQRLVSLGLVLAALLSFFHVFDFVARPLLRPLDSQARAVVDGIAFRAGTAFAVSKTINAALSFAEDVTITGSAFVVEGSVQPAALLKPVNNLVDQFARIMLAVAASALVIEILLRIGAGYGTWILVTLPLGLFAAATFRPQAAWAPRILRVARATAVLAVVVRLALPLALGLSGSVSDRFLADRYHDASAGLDVLSEASDTAAEAVQEANAASWPGKLRSAVSGALSLVGESFSDTFHNIVTLVTIFFMETILLPLMILFLLYRGLHLLTARRDRL